MFDLNNIIEEIPDFDSYSKNINIIYGVVYDLPLALIEVLFDINDSRNIYLTRHLITFLVFFSSTIYFYKLIYFNPVNYNNQYNFFI